MLMLLASQELIVHTFFTGARRAVIIHPYAADLLRQVRRRDIRPEFYRPHLRPTLAAGNTADIAIELTLLVLTPELFTIQSMIRHCFYPFFMISDTGIPLCENGHSSVIHIRFRQPQAAGRIAACSKGGMRMGSGRSHGVRNEWYNMRQQRCVCTHWHTIKCIRLLYRHMLPYIRTNVRFICENRR